MSVGVVVPTLCALGRLDLLREAISSIRSQSGVDVRLVVVTGDTGSAELADLMPDVTVLAQSGGGIVDAIECGWAELPPDVEYLAWLGDDDRLVDGALEAAEGALRARPEVGMVFGRCRYIAYDGSELREIRPGRIAVPLLRMGTNLIAQPGAIYRRSAVAAIGGLARDLSLAFDVDLHLRIARGLGAVYLPRVLGEVRAHPGSLTISQRERSAAELEQVTTRGLGPVALKTRKAWRPLVHLAGRVVYKLSSRLPAERARR